MLLTPSRRFCNLFAPNWLVYLFGRRPLPKNCNLILEPIHSQKRPHRNIHILHTYKILLMAGIISTCYTRNFQIASLADLKLLSILAASINNNFKSARLAASKIKLGRLAG